MDIQRGDQVYYRGEVWTVLYITPEMYGEQEARIHVPGDLKDDKNRWVPVSQLQRVEQVR